MPARRAAPKRILSVQFLSASRHRNGPKLSVFVTAWIASAFDYSVRKQTLIFCAGRWQGLTYQRGANKVDEFPCGQYAFAITARRSTASPVTIHLPGPSKSSRSGMHRTDALNSLIFASHA